MKGHAETYATRINYARGEMRVYEALREAAQEELDCTPWYRFHRRRALRATVTRHRRDALSYRKVVAHLERLRRNFLEG